MPMGSVRLVPGVNATKTETLNEAGISESQLIRFRDGLVQKIGGWVEFCREEDEAEAGGEDTPGSDGSEGHILLSADSETGFAVALSSELPDELPYGTGSATIGHAYDIRIVEGEVDGSDIYLVADPETSPAAFRFVLTDDTYVYYVDQSGPTTAYIARVDLTDRLDITVLDWGTPANLVFNANTVFGCTIHDGNIYLAASVTGSDDTKLVVIDTSDFTSNGLSYVTVTGFRVLGLVGNAGYLYMTAFHDTDYRIYRLTISTGVLDFITSTHKLFGAIKHGDKLIFAPEGFNPLVTTNDRYFAVLDLTAAFSADALTFVDVTTDTNIAHAWGNDVNEAQRKEVWVVNDEIRLLCEDADRNHRIGSFDLETYEPRTGYDLTDLLGGGAPLVAAVWGDFTYITVNRNPTRIVKLANDFSSSEVLSTEATDTPPNDNFIHAQEIFAGETLTADISASTFELGEPDHGGIVNGSRSAWWVFTAPSNSDFVISTEGSDFDTVLAVYTGTAIDDLTEVDSDDDSGDGETSELTLSATADTVYYIAVAGKVAVGGNVSLSVTLVESGSIPAGHSADADFEGNAYEYGGNPITLAEVVDQTGYRTANGLELPWPGDEALLQDDFLTLVLTASWTMRIDAVIATPSFSNDLLWAEGATTANRLYWGIDNDTMFIDGRATSPAASLFAEDTTPAITADRHVFALTVDGLGVAISKDGETAVRDSAATFTPSLSAAALGGIIGSGISNAFIIKRLTIYPAQADVDLPTYSAL